MRISVKGEYALQALFDLACRPPGEPVKIAAISRRQKIPQKFLELILASLKQGGFVESRRGAEGGYLLARPAEAITVGEVLEYFEGTPRRRRTVDSPFADMWRRVDQAIAEKLRRTGRPVLLAVNKLDDLPNTAAIGEFYGLGLGEPIGVSAAVGKQSGDLLDEMVARMPDPESEEDDERLEVAIVGRPNVGKSSLANKLLGEERYVVSPVAGTTRDAVDTPLKYHGRTILFIDTAGLRRHAKVQDDVEFYSTIRTEQAIERADVCVLVVDAAEGMSNQDLRIATEAWEHGCGLIVAVNKWDLIAEKDANTARRGEEGLIVKAPFLEYVPFVYVSALSGQRVRKILDLIIEVADARQVRVKTAEVNRVLEALVARQMPPQQTGDEVKLLYATQIGTAPPTIAIVSNRPTDVPESYQRYLMHGFRKEWPFLGSPLRLKFSLRGSREHSRTQGDGRR